MFAGVGYGLGNQRINNTLLVLVEHELQFGRELHNDFLAVLLLHFPANRIERAD